MVTDTVAQVNRAIDFVTSNLDGDLRLHNVARAAAFSPFHFHRVFRAAMGETLHQFVKRVRLERALTLMLLDPARSLTDIALACGFASSSDFSRSFGAQYGSAPSRFDLDAWRDARRNELESLAEGSAYRLDRLPIGTNPDGFRVTLRSLPPRTVAYTRVLDPYRVDAVPRASEVLMAWADQHGLGGGQWLGYQWENPEVVPLRDCRYDVAVVVPSDLADPSVATHRFPAMQVAEVPLAGDISLEMRALDWIYGTWLPQSPFVPDDQPAFEAWAGRPFAHGVEWFELSMQLPVRRRRT